MMNIKENFQNKEPDKLIGIAAILQGLPLPFVYWILTFVTIVVAFCIYLFFGWMLLIGKISVGCVVVYKIAKFFYDRYHYVRRENAGTRAIEEHTRKLLLGNVKIEKQLNVYDRLPYVMEYAIEQVRNIKFGGLEVSHHLSNLHMIQPGTEVEQIEAPASPLPTLVRYDDIRHQIPEGHNVVGIADTGLITKEDKHIGACVWIIGGSGSGKTSTTSLRLEERSSCGHQFYGVDPHWFKDDSLTNAVVGFSDRFLLPMARDTKEAKHVLSTFLKEFQDRKAGIVAKPFQKITLVVDEVGSLNDPQCEEEEEVLKLLKTITRVCGQEARNFNMGGIFISQQATGLYWIGNVALLVVVHKLLKENQQRLATQSDDKQLFAEMRLWPKGRSYVYGMGLEEGEGCLVMQQPYFEKRGSGQWVYSTVEEIEDTSTPLPFPVGRAQNRRAEDVDLSEAIRYWNETYEDRGKVPTVKDIEARYQLTNHQARRLINDFILQVVVNE